jgi:hypothetical protein
MLACISFGLSLRLQQADWVQHSRSIIKVHGEVPLVLCRFLVSSMSGVYSSSRCGCRRVSKVQNAAAGNRQWPGIIIMLPNQAIASMPSAPRLSGAEGRGSTAPLCLQLLRTSQACTRYSAILLEITRHLPLLACQLLGNACNCGSIAKSGFRVCGPREAAKISKTESPCKKTLPPRFSWTARACLSRTWHRQSDCLAFARQLPGKIEPLPSAENRL